MFEPAQYQLVDFGSDEKGGGRKLENFGGSLVSRVSPPATRSVKKWSQKWADAVAEFRLAENGATHGSPKEPKGNWVSRSPLPDPWILRFPHFSLKLKPTPFGHLGVFPEQQENWNWIIKKIGTSKREMKVLNLFGYTGGSSLAAAAAGGHVTHVDSAKNIVSWARENAKLSAMADAPIRWITEDCRLFVEREIKRKNHYDAIILDPPSFGHGPKGEVWKMERDLISLLRNCRKLLSNSPEFLLLTSHSPGYGPAELQATLGDAIFGSCSTQVFAGPLFIPTPDGRKLNAGNLARWPVH